MDEKEFNYTRKETRSLINYIFLMISDINYDAFELSKSHIDQRALDFRYRNFPGKESICDKAFEIKMNFINMIDDIVCGKFGTFEALESESKLDKIVTFMCKMLDDFLVQEAGETEQEDYYYRQLALGDNNVPVLVLDVAWILEDLKKIVPLRLILSKLIKICKDNKVLQAQLFQQHMINKFNHINKEQGLMIALVTTSIFENNNEILYLMKENFD